MATQAPAPVQPVEHVPTVKARPLFDPPIVRRAIVDSFLKLDPRTLWRNPVMFVVEVVSVIVTVRLISDATSSGPVLFDSLIAFWLWFTVIFANFAEAMAEGRGKAQADALRKARKDVSAKKLSNSQYRAKYNIISATSLRKDDVVLVEAGDVVPGDGEVIEGVA